MRSLFQIFATVAMSLTSLAVCAQGITTASINGLVSDGAGGPLPGAVIEAVHGPTGTRYSSVTRADGRYHILNMRVGGPYSVTASMTGFSTQKRNDIFLQLGEDERVDFNPNVESIEEELVVVASANPIINSSKTGAEANISAEVIESLPTLSRSIEDFARTSAYFNVVSENGEVGALSVAGRNNRYNSILIDGAVNNDLFGLSDNGNPGGQADAQPISVEALQELQLVIAPYDIRQGGFTGGGVNAVTKSGTNAYQGSLFYFTRDQDFVGTIEDRELGSFKEAQSGISFGGPIIKDRAFFFVTGDIRRNDVPSGWAIRPEDGSGSGQNFGRYEEAVLFRDTLIERYGYDPGGFEEVTRNTDYDNIFARFDFNISPEHRLTVRHNYVSAEKYNIYPGSFTYNFPNNGYRFPNETNSTVVQLNSTFGEYYNEFRVSYQTISDNRGEGTLGDPFPWIEIENLPGGGEFEVGTERFSTANSLDQEIIEITNDLTFFRGNHTITLGTHNEFFSFDNLFIRENYGAYQFNSFDDFLNGWAEQYDYSFSATDDPQQSAKFDVQQLGFYAGDQWAVKPNLTLTYGLRLDIPLLPDSPTYNADIEDEFGLRTDEMPDGNLLWSPRIGFNYDINDDNTMQLRGGIGIFTGRAPYVWVANQYTNTGIEFTRISARVSGDVSEDNHIEFNPDPFNQPETLEGVRVSSNEVDVMDPDFEFPQVMRANIAYDHDIGFFGLIGTAEFIYSKTLNDILYQNLNLVPTGETLTFDGRPTFDSRDNDLSDVIYLTNHSEGDQQTFNIKVERPWSKGWFASTSYLYNSSDTLSDGTSSQALSNWRYLEVPGDPNHPPVATSDFEVQHRFNIAMSYKYDWNSVTQTTISLFYNAQSGRPYSTIFDGDANGDNQFGNDLLYVPNSEDEIILEGATWAEFNAYIEADAGLSSHRGEIVPRNASREPWRRALDLSVKQDVHLSRYKFQITLDVFNFLNAIDDTAGRHKYTQFGAVSPVSWGGIDDATGKPVYEVDFTDPDDRFQLDDLRSRWRAQLGLRFGF